jgi:hypothetical protein
LASDWWNCKETRKQINLLQERRAAAQIKEINSAYKAAKIPGATPQHWLGKISRMNKLGRPMPKGFEHLAGSTIDEDTRAFLESGRQSAHAYFASENAEIRAKNFKITQKEFATSVRAKVSQAEGGNKSAAVRRLNRKNLASEIVGAYLNAKRMDPLIKPLARLVAEWCIESKPGNKSKRALIQMLKRAEVAR